MVDIQDHGGLPHPQHDARFYAGVPARRAVAFVIDTVAALLLGIAAMLAVGIATLGFGFLFGGLVMVLTGLLYRAASLVRWSATPGMLLTGIELRRHDGEVFAPGDAVTHTLLFALCLASGIVQLISVVCMLAMPLGRGIPDLILGSAAINRPA